MTDEAFLRLLDASRALRSGLTLGKHEQVYLTGDHYWYTVRYFDEVLADVVRHEVERIGTSWDSSGIDIDAALRDTP